MAKSPDVTICVYKILRYSSKDLLSFLSSTLVKKEAVKKPFSSFGVPTSATH